MQADVRKIRRVHLPNMTENVQVYTGKGEKKLVFLLLLLSPMIDPPEFLEFYFLLFFSNSLALLQEHKIIDVHFFILHFFLF